MVGDVIMMNHNPPVKTVSKMELNEKCSFVVS